jgi:hypothetical protein
MSLGEFWLCLAIHLGVRGRWGLSGNLHLQVSFSVLRAMKIWTVNGHQGNPRKYVFKGFLVIGEEVTLFLWPSKWVVMFSYREGK